MAERTRFSRFRIPWLSAPPPTATPFPTRPAAETRSRSESTADAVPIQRPPFRPPGRGSVQSRPTQAQSTSRAEPEARSSPRQPQSAPTSSDIKVESQVTSKPESPPREVTQSLLKSPKPSPSRSDKNQPSSPTPTRENPPSGNVSLSTSFYKASNPAGATSGPDAVQERNMSSETTQLTPSVGSKLEGAETKNASEPQRQKQESQSDGISEPRENSTLETSSQPNVENKRLKGDLDDKQTTSLQEALRALNKTSSETTNAHSKPPEKDLALQESMKEEKTKSAGIEKTEVERSTSAIPSAAETKEIHTMSAEENKHHKEAGDDEKNVLTNKSIPGDQELEVGELAAFEHITSNASNIPQPKPHDSSDGNGGAQLHKGIREDISKFVHKLATGYSNRTMDDKPVTVLTVSGENKGAIMHLSSELAKKEESVHIYRGYRTNPDESPYVTTDGERSFRGGNKDSADKVAFTKAYMNSNAQGINNSIMFRSFIHEKNPGVHLILPRKPADSIKSNDKPEVMETRKAEFNITPAKKQTYQPVVRRRCLRGLFLESSDSDPDNMNKPRRHGCRYSCKLSSKDKDIGIL